MTAVIEVTGRVVRRRSASWLRSSCPPQDARRGVISDCETDGFLPVPASFVSL